MKDKMTPVSGIQGLNKDQTFQTPNQVTFALNAIRDSHDGGKPEYQSEPGNEIVGSLPSGYFLLGWIYGQDNSVYLFSTNESLSEIGKFKQGVYTTLVNANLGFNRLYPITGVYRVKNGCNKTIYWSDHYNPDRWFNEDNPDEFKTGGVFDPNKFKIQPDILPVNIDLVKVNDFGGKLPLGSYYFSVDILDKNENLIYRSDITPQTIIYSEDQKGAYNDITGGLNIPQYDVNAGAVPNTNKSITLRFSNINTSFEYLRLNVIRKIFANDNLDGYQLGTLIPISSDSFEYNFTGINEVTGDTIIDVSELLVAQTKYESSYVGEQVQGRYLRANIKQKKRDYSQYQQYASGITAKWVAEEVSVGNSTALGNPKNPKTYWEKLSFQGDEIYLPGIVFLHNDGEVSPVLPLIGRAATSDDLQLLTVVANNASLSANDIWLSDVEHLGLSVGDTIERWKVLNTATITSSQTTTHPYSYEGEFGYYETDQTYPEIRDCEDNLIWGNSVNITDKVRLFKFPDRRLVSHYQSEGVYQVPFGIKFDNIVYPNADVVGHIFVYAKRDQINKTVDDSGWISRAFEEVNLTIPPSFTELGIVLTGQIAWANAGVPDKRTARYLSGDITFNNRLHGSDYLKLNKFHEVTFLPLSSSAVYPFASPIADQQLDMQCGISNNQDLPVRTNHKIVKQLFIEPNSYLTGASVGRSIYNQDFMSPDSVINLSYQLEDAPVSFSTQTPTLLHHMYVYKKNLNQPYKDILGGYEFEKMSPNYIYSTDTNNNVFYGGDTLIALSLVTKSIQAGAVNVIVYSYCNFLEERQINTSLKHGYQLDPVTSINLLNGDHRYYIDKAWDKDLTTGDYSFKDNPIPEYYALNSDYNVSKKQQYNSTLPIQFDYCSDCINVFPYRIIWSPKSFDEESFDLYRVFNTNDYIDLPGHTGGITGLKYINNQLLVHTENSTYILQPSPQQIQTDQNTAYLGTGDFLSVPPVELLPVNIGYGGCQSKQHQCETPYGHCWLDQKKGELFRFDNRLERMVSGLEQWLREYLPSELQSEYYRVYEKEYPIKVTTHQDGIGCILYYDPRFKRLLITKQEFLPIELLNPKDNPTQSYQTIYDGRWIQATTGFPITYGNPTYFINKSWTLSYGFEFNSDDVKPFISWHSYRPYQAFNDTNNFYTLNRFTNGTYRHKHKQSYQRFYNTKYDFIIEYQIFDLSTDRLSSVHYTGYTYEWDNTNQDWLIRDKTFNQILCYNNNQSTGLQDLTLLTNPYQNVFLQNNSKFVIKTDQNYKIAGLVDYSTGQPVMTKDWSLLQTYPSYIDKIPYTSNIDFNKSAYAQGKLWDKFVNVRLFFKPTEDYKKIIILSSVNEQESIR